MFDWWTSNSHIAAEAAAADEIPNIESMPSILTEKMNASVEDEEGTELSSIEVCKDSTTNKNHTKKYKIVVGNLSNANTLRIMPFIDDARDDVATALKTTALTVSGDGERRDNAMEEHATISMARLNKNSKSVTVSSSLLYCFISHMIVMMERFFISHMMLSSSHQGASRHYERYHIIVVAPITKHGRLRD